LTDNEKKKLTTFLEFKNNFSKILQAINLGFGNFTKPSNFFNFGSNNKNTTQKKWVRNDKNDNIKVWNKKIGYLKQPKKTTGQLRKNIMN